MSELTILYQDEHYVAVDKPAGLLVHRSPISCDETFLLQQLRDQLRQWVYPLHRLDRPTSGVIVFALHPDAARRLSGRFERHEVRKTYRAVVRGWSDEAGTIDHPLREDKHKPPQPAVSHYRRLAGAELPYPIGRYASARYSLLELRPETGRMHQLRKHCKHMAHPIIGDTSYGKGDHNRLFREQFGIERLLLWATELAFTHPYNGERLCLAVEADETKRRLYRALGWEALL